MQISFDNIMPAAIKKHIYKSYQRHPYYQSAIAQAAGTETGAGAAGVEAAAAETAAEAAAETAAGASTAAIETGASVTETAAVETEAAAVEAAGAAAGAAVTEAASVETGAAAGIASSSPHSKAASPLHLGFSVLQNDYAENEKMARFIREKTAERVVHACGAGAYGVFEVTHDLTRYTCADVFSRVGKRTDIFTRFSTFSGSSGSAEAVRDARGFAIKFYTDFGCYDIVGSSLPVFFIREPDSFPDFVRSQRPEPISGIPSPDHAWDFLTLVPESVHAVTMLYSSRGIPASCRHMHGYGTNTFMWYNETSEHCFVKYHFLSEQGIKTLTDAQAATIRANDPFSSRRDLFEAVAKGNHPSWRVYVQIMTPEQANSYIFDPFDNTKVWFKRDFPLLPLGRLTLNRNPANYFNEVERSAFCPSNLVRGVAPSPDRMLLRRMAATKDSQRHRLGEGFDKIAVNAAKNSGQGISADTNYYPNSFSDTAYPPPLKIEGTLRRATLPRKGIDYIQAGEFYRRVLSEAERAALVDNLTASLNGVQKFIKYRACCLFYLADSDYGERVAAALGLNIDKVKDFSSLEQGQRLDATRGIL